MPPTPVDDNYVTDGKKNKIGMARGTKVTTSFSEQLAKHEWEQVGNLTVRQVAKKIQNRCCCPL